MRRVSCGGRDARPSGRAPAGRAVIYLTGIALLAAGACETRTSTTGRSRGAPAWSVAERAGALYLLGVDFVDASRGWAVGDIDPRGTGGAVFHTVDGGRHWAPLTGRTEVSTSVHFIDQTTGWIAGYAGRIDRSDDGGRSWQPQRPERGREVFNSLWAVDARHAWAVGVNGLGVRTIDGGATWTPMATGAAGDLWSVRFVSAERGWAVGDAGVIVSTNDGGATWTSAASGTGKALYGLAVVPPGIVVAVGEGGTILRSGEGAAWTGVTSPVTAALDSVAARERTVWAVGTGGTTIGSRDGGASWSAIAPLAGERLTGVALGDPDHGAAVGRKGYVQVLQ